jgi:vacuolar-type H+-ATPase subunit E/Vma4
MIQEASESAELTIKEAQDFAKKTLEKQKLLGAREATEEASRMLKKAANEAEVERLRKIANTKITANWIVLSKKEEIISKVIGEARDRIKAMTQNRKYITILENLIIEGATVLNDTELEIMLNEKDSTLGLNLGDLTKKIYEQTGTKTKFTLSEEKLDVLGGVILRTKDRKTVMDCSFDDVLRRKEIEIRSEIAKILF